MYTHRLIAAGSLVMGLAGCATAPLPATPAAQAPAQWYSPLPHNGALADLSRWWMQFDDPLLVQLVESAQTQSPTVASARSRILQARATRLAAGAALLPTLDGSLSAQRSSLDPPSSPITLAQAGLTTNWEIDLFGGNRQAVNAAQLRFEGAQAGWHDARVSVAAETANSYFNLRSCERQLAVARNDAQSRAETSRLTGLATDAGFQAPATAALARASAAEGAARATQQRAQCDIEVKTLVALTAMPEDELRRKLGPASTAPAPEAPLAVASVPAQALTQRPDVFVAEREVAAASADLGVAQAQRYPRLSLTGSIAVGSARVGGRWNDLRTWAIGPLALSVPFFDGGASAANVEAAQARYEEAAALYAARVRQAVREVEEALINLESTRSRSEDARTATEGYRASFVATEARYKAGLASLVELEDARRTALAAENALIALQRERVGAWVALYRAAGGGWAPPAADMQTASKP